MFKKKTMAANSTMKHTLKKQVFHQLFENKSLLIPKLNPYKSAGLKIALLTIHFSPYNINYVYQTERS